MPVTVIQKNGIDDAQIFRPAGESHKNNELFPLTYYLLHTFCLKPRGKLPGIASKSNEFI